MTANKFYFNYWKMKKKMWTRELITATIWNLTQSTCEISVGGTSVHVKMAVVECHLLSYSFILNIFLFKKHLKSFRYCVFIHLNLRWPCSRRICLHWIPGKKVVWQTEILIYKFLLNVNVNKWWYSIGLRVIDKF